MTFIRELLVVALRTMFRSFGPVVLGLFNVTLTVVDEKGQQATTSKAVTVK